MKPLSPEEVRKIVLDIVESNEYVNKKLILLGKRLEEEYNKELST